MTWALDVVLRRLAIALTLNRNPHRRQLSLYSGFELGTRVKGHDPSRANGYRFTGLGISSRASGFVTEGEVAEAGNLHFTTGG